MKHKEGNVIGYGPDKVKAILDCERRKKFILVKPHIEFVHILQTWHVFSPLAEGYGQTMMKAWEDYDLTIKTDAERLFKHQRDAFLTALPEFPWQEKDY